MSKLARLIDSKTLNALIQSKAGGIKVLDCTYARFTPPEFTNLEEFKKKYYGNLPELLKLPSPNRDNFLSSHIPTSNFIDTNIATHPAQYEPWALYEPKIFEKYAQFLGINSDDHLILYGRGPMGGLLWAGKIYWLFRAYGHEKLSILNGGLADWQKNGFAVETLAELPKVPPGDFQAKFHPSLMVKFEEVVHDDLEADNLKELAKKANILDARGRGQYNGTEDTGFDPTKVTGSYIPGTKNVPVGELVNAEGHLKPKEEIEQKLKEANFDRNKPSITMCNLGTQASLLAFILEDVDPESKIRVYNGSNKEIEARDPKKISGR